MAKTRKLMLGVLGACLIMGNVGCFTFYNVVPWPIAVPPWVSERMEEKYTKRLKEDRTPIMPPILPGAPVPTCDDPPSEEQVIRALPRVARGIPFIFEEFRDDFNVVIEKDEDGYYVASVPSLPGCHTQARSLDELMERVREAIAAYLDAGEDVEELEFVGVRQVSVPV